MSSLKTFSHLFLSCLCFFVFSFFSSRTMVSISNEHVEMEETLTTCADFSDDDAQIKTALTRKHQAVAFLFIPTARELRRAQRRARRARNARFQRYDLSLGQVVQSSMFVQYILTNIFFKFSISIIVVLTAVYSNQV